MVIAVVHATSWEERGGAASAIAAMAVPCCRGWGAVPGGFASGERGRGAGFQRGTTLARTWWWGWGSCGPVRRRRAVMPSLPGVVAIRVGGRGRVRPLQVGVLATIVPSGIPMVAWRVRLVGVRPAKGRWRGEEGSWVPALWWCWGLVADVLIPIVPSVDPLHRVLLAGVSCRHTLQIWLIAQGLMLCGLGCETVLCC